MTIDKPEGELKILVLETDERNRRGLISLAESCGHEALGSTSLQDAVDLLNAEHPDLFILDSKLFEKESDDTLRELKSAAPEVFIIVITETASIEKAIEAVRKGAFDFILRPCLSAYLPLVIKRLEKRLELKREKILCQDQLHESQRFLASVLEGIGDAVVVIDRDFSIISANRGYLGQTKRTVGELIGRRCYEISHGFSRPCDEMGEDCAVRKTFEDGLPHSAVHEHTAKDGSKLFVLTKAFPLRDADNSVYAVVETIADITEQVRLDRMLEESEKKYRTLYNNAPDFMHSLDVNGYIMECNETELRALGYQRDELIGKHVKEIIAPEYHELFDEKFQTLKDRGSAIAEWHILKKNGERVLVLVKSSAIYDESGKFVKSSAIMRDMTELWRLQREKEYLMEQLVQAQKMEAVGNLAAGIAHDFNNMLTGIAGFAEVALSKYNSPNIAKGHLRRILQISKQASLLTEQILIIGRKAAVRKKPLDINKFMAASMPTIRRMVKKNNIVVEAKYGNDVLPVEADEGQIYQVILNLVVNARDAMPSGGKITIRTGLSGKWFYDLSGDCSATEKNEGKDHVFISVSDTGHGIPAEVKRNIFDPFFSTKEPGKGTGLGLAVVYSIVQGHNGGIHVKSEEGKGTEFYLTFPVMPFFEPVAEDKRDIELEKVAGRGKSVLVVDDDEIVRDVIMEILPEYGFNVTAVEDSIKALEIFRSSPVPFDLVMIDMVMPGMSGREVLKQVRELNPAQKTVFLTGYALPSEIDEIKNLGISSILKKPFNIEELFRIILSALE